jgi:hypothetical protein
MMSSFKKIGDTIIDTLATKDDLKPLATKEGIKDMATKSDISTLETRLSKIEATQEQILKLLQQKSE